MQALPLAVCPVLHVQVGLACWLFLPLEQIARVLQPPFSELQ
jgi:hypothetical protein